NSPEVPCSVRFSSPGFQLVTYVPRAAVISCSVVRCFKRTLLVSVVSDGAGSSVSLQLVSENATVSTNSTRKFLQLYSMMHQRYQFEVASQKRLRLCSQRRQIQLVACAASPTNTNA